MKHQQATRQLLDHERPVVAYLFELANIAVDLDTLLVRPMADGGMGSLAIAPLDASRRLGTSPAECHFYDVDGVPVSAMLNLDQYGRPFEIDVWRVDFEPTAEWPARSRILAGPIGTSASSK